MRTTLDLDDDLLTALGAKHPDLSKTAAIELAIRSYLGREAEAGLRRLAGQVEIEDMSAELRKADRRT